MPTSRSEFKFADLERVELSVSKALEGAEVRDIAPSAISQSCFACFCTKGCISSVSSTCTLSARVADQDPEVVQAIMMLHDRALDVLGEERMAEALRSRLPEAISR